jgi:hypothetical protein
LLDAVDQLDYLEIKGLFNSSTSRTITDPWDHRPHFFLSLGQFYNDFSLVEPDFLHICGLQDQIRLLQECYIVPTLASPLSTAAADRPCFPPHPSKPFTSRTTEPRRIPSLELPEIFALSPPEKTYFHVESRTTGFCFEGFWEDQINLNQG